MLALVLVGCEKNNDSISNENNSKPKIKYKSCLR